MASRTAAGPLSTLSETPLPHSIDIVDLTSDRASRVLWRSSRQPSFTLARPGWSSPMGYWLVAGSAPPDSPSAGALRLEIGPDEAASNHETTHPKLLGRPPQTIRLKGPRAADGDLLLTIGPAGGRVVTSQATWSVLSEAVLLAACQYWRFGDLDKRLDWLTERGHGDVAEGGLGMLLTYRKRRALLATAQNVRALLLDLPHFMEPLTDPLPFCSSERSAQAYRTLAEQLHLEAWCEALDARAEAVAETYATITEKLSEYRSFAWAAGLEVTIVLILLADLIFQVWQHAASD